MLDSLLLGVIQFHVMFSSFYFLQIFRFEMKPYLYHPSKNGGKIQHRKMESSTGKLIRRSGMLRLAAKDADLFDFQVQEGDLLVLGRVPQSYKRTPCGWPGDKYVAIQESLWMLNVNIVFKYFYMTFTKGIKIPHKQLVLFSKQGQITVVR